MFTTDPWELARLKRKPTPEEALAIARIFYKFGVKLMGYNVTVQKDSIIETYISSFPWQDKLELEWTPSEYADELWKNWPKVSNTLKAILERTGYGF